MNIPKYITVVKTLTGTGALADEWREPHGCLQSVIDSPAPGFIRQILLGAEGLQIRHGEHQVCIPKALLLKLGESVQPAIKPPTPAFVQKAIAQNTPLVPSPK
jgi:hypothetical protein